MRPVHVVAILFTFALVAPAFLATPGSAAGSSFTYATHAGPAAADGAGEPSIGVNWNTGNAFFQDFATTWRVSFDDSSIPATASWEDVTPINSITNVDPILFTDRTLGRTWAGGLNGQCSVLAFTDDDGASWTPTGNACASPAFDHQTIGSGPWNRADPSYALAQYPHALYYCAQYVFDECATSYDGGLTFTPGLIVSTGSCLSLHGSVDVAPNGAAYLPIRSCGTGSGVAVSTTNGRIWYTKPLPAGRQANGFDPDVATTPSSFAYVAYPAANGSPHVVLMKGNGLGAMVGPWDVGAAVGVKTTAFVEMVAGDDSRAAVAFLATTTPGNAFAEGFAGVWHIYVATTLDSGATWTVVKVTDDPVQRGWICAAGIGCPDTGTRGRNLLDFFDATVDKDGRVLVGFADGCVGPCALPGGTEAQSKSDYGTIIRQSCGASLFAAKGDVEGARPCVATPPVPPTPVPLTGTLYMRGTAPVGLADNLGDIVLPSESLVRAAPTGQVPKVATNQGVLGGTNVRTIYDAVWSANVPDSGYALDATPVTVRLFVVAAGGNTPSTAPWKVVVALSDVAPGANGPMTGAFATASVAVLPSATPTEVVVTFPPQTKLLTNGLTVTVGTTGAGEVSTLYDAASTPTRIEFG